MENHRNQLYPLQQQQEANEQRQLLLDTLSRLWYNYLHTTKNYAIEQSVQHGSIKKHWLQLFLYYFQFVSKEILQTDDYKSFFNTIPEEICSYLIEQVYKIISTAKGTQTTTTPVASHYQEVKKTVYDKEIYIEQLCRQHNFDQLILSTPSDCNKIVALRTFLTNDLGHHLLQFLIKVDINLITSQKSLVHLCINLFPNCNWSTYNIRLQRQTNVKDLLDNFKAKTSKRVLSENQNQYQWQIVNQSEFNENISKFEDFRNATRSSDELCLFFIQILTKCVDSELLETEVIITIYNFALDCLCVCNKNNESKEETQTFLQSTTVAAANEDIIKIELLQLIAHCINNFYANAVNATVIDFNGSFSQLLYALIANRWNTHLSYIILYLMFGMLEKQVDLHIKECSHGLQFPIMALLNIESFDSCFVLMNEIQCRNIEPSTSVVFIEVYKTLLRITDKIARYEQQIFNSTDLNMSRNCEIPCRRKVHITHQFHCSKYQQRSLCCYFQGKLFELLPLLSSELQEESIRYWLRTGSCCCHYNLANYATFLRQATQVSAIYQKCAYKFLHYHILNALYAPNTNIVTMREGTPNKKLQIQCNECLEKIKSQTFYTSLLALYKDSYDTLTTDDSVKMLNFLKHLKHIAYQLTYIMASGILAEIALPIFRVHKTIIISPNNNSNSKKLDKLHLCPTLSRSYLILRECLSIFVRYLKDIRLIKAFYIEENIRHMEDLLNVPFLHRCICDLIKAGIDNITFLGDNSDEQVVLSRRLLTLQLNSSSNAADLFHSVLVCLTSKKFWIDDYKHSEQSLAGHNPGDILYIATLQWMLNWELVSTSPIFYNEFAKMYSIDVILNIDGDEEECNKECRDLHSEYLKRSETYSTRIKYGEKTIIDILKLNYNALSCFLFMHRANQTKTTKPSVCNTQQPDSDTNDNSTVCCSSSLETLYSSLQLPTVSLPSSTISSLATSKLSTLASPVDYNIEFNSTPQLTTTTTFLQRLQASQLDESIVLFDIRNQLLSDVSFEKYSTTRSHILLNSIKNVTSIRLLSTSSDATNLEQLTKLTIQQQQQNDSLISKFFNMVGSLFGTVNHSSTELLTLQTDKDLLCLQEKYGENKRLLLKLFESSLAICIKGYQNKNSVDKMKKHLERLKLLIMSHAQENWEEYAELDTRDNTIIQTLQTLLKIAEICNAHNEPTDKCSRKDGYESNSTAKVLRPTQSGNTSSFNSVDRNVFSTEIRKMENNDTFLLAKNSTQTSERPFTGESGDAEYFSARPSLQCVDSEVDYSENDNDYNIKADEGYEADCEVPEVTEQESDFTIGDIRSNSTYNYEDLWRSLQPSSRYRTHVMHDGVCRLVIEILIDLSIQCAEKPSQGWIDTLMQLTNRLYVLRDYLGGDLFLLRGFVPVLSNSDSRLRELQQSILELVTYFNTPELLTTYCSILATKNPPVDILIKYMQHNTVNSLKKVQPYVQLEFPVIFDGNCNTTTENELYEKIERIRSYHMMFKVCTPFTRAPCIIPVRGSRLWHDDGVTVSLWLELRNQHSRSSSMHVNNDDTRNSIDNLTKTHIVSLGTNQVMLSIYINNNMQLVFELWKPNAEISMCSASPDTNEPNEKMNSATKEPLRRRINEDQYESSLSMRQTLKQTKTAFLNSLSQMHFMNEVHDKKKNGSFEVAQSELKSLRLLKNKWTHLVFGIDSKNDHVEVTIFIDGLESSTITIPFRNFRILARLHNFQILALGDSKTAQISPTGSCSTLDNGILCLNIASLMLFKRKIIVQECIWNLTAMGPDYTDLNICQVGNRKPNYGFVNLTKMTHANFGNFKESVKILEQLRVLTYTAQQPDVVIYYDNKNSEIIVNRAGIILYAELLQNKLQSIQTMSVLCGGLAPLLFLFARVVELTSSPYSQSLALDLLLSVAQSESQLYTEFQCNDYISLIGYVIKTERCSKNVVLLKSIINNACTQMLIIKKGDTLQVNENTIAILIYPRLLISVLHRYSDWHRSGTENCDVLEMLFHSILALTREKHPHRDFNMEQLQIAGLMKELLNLYKVYVIESPNPVYISELASEYFVQIIAVFAGSPPLPSLLDEIMKLIMLLQKPSECYITHDRAKFYFLLTPQLPAKERSSVVSNLSRVTTSFRRSTQLTSQSRAEVFVNDPENKGMLRIKRLRQLYSSNSSYRRVLHEFEENLENVADCKKLNKPALRLISPISAERWRLKYKRRAACNSLHSLFKEKGNTSRTIYSPQKIIRRRLHMHSIRNEFSKNQSFKKLKQLPNSSVAGSVFGFESDGYGIGNANIKSSIHQHTKLTLKTDFYNSLGIVTLQRGLLMLLKDFLCLLPDSAVNDVLKHYVKIEYLLVLANNKIGAVRAAIIQLLAALTKRLSANELNASCKQLYPLHLANQLAIHPSTPQMFEACVSWLTEVYGNLTIILNCDETLRIRHRFVINAILAISSKTSIDHPDYAKHAFKVLHKIFVNNPDEQQTIIDSGLIQCCVKALYNLHTYAVNINSKTELSIVNLLATVGEKSLKSVGQINIIWDILNMLAFYQEKQSITIVRSFRSVQALLQISWLKIYFEKTNMPWHFKVITPNDCAVTLLECRTRFDMLIDRCSQFFTTYEWYSYSPSEHEIKLFELLVSYGISTNQRCNNFIAWGLQPSRPRELRELIIDALWITCQDDFQQAIICDGKRIKALLWLNLLEDLTPPIENLPRLCESLGISASDSTWNLENELEQIEMHRYSVSTKQKGMLEKTIFKYETLVQQCIESSMVTTRRVAELQNAERKLLMSHMKDYDDTYTSTKWSEIIRRMTHEGAPWYCKDRTECFWELDDTEGPSRVHTRLRRCHLDIDKRFFMHDKHNNITADYKNDYVRPLEYLMSNYDQQLNISLNSQVLYNFPAKFLPVDGEIDGEIIITDHKLYFLATYRCKYFNLNCDIASITEIWLKRYQHQEKAFEIFLDTNKSMFFSLHNQDDWKIMRDVFCDKIIIMPDNGKIQLITQQWREGLLTNWEYLMTLNQIAGRTFNDLMQYPIFPWILSNYKSDVLDLTEAENFRKLEKPIAVQCDENEQHYIDNYNYINNTLTNMGSITLKPYHYSSHYSNSGTVLHFLVRVPPFTGYFLRYQDNNFDLPDRTFHSLATTWYLASRDSPTDVKEIIPEFFCLPEMFENFQQFNFGCRQNGDRVNDVLLPNWSQCNPRLFVLIHRQALESELVRRNLHNWIDLIFGEKQIGDKAVEAINVFHPATYAVFLESEIVDPIERKAVETMVKTYGQMPRQLFKTPHPPSKTLNYNLVDKQILPFVRGLRWGVYTGSPQLSPPRLGNIAKLPNAEKLVSFNNTNVVYGLHAKSCIMQGAEFDIYNVISWGDEDRIVRIQPLNKPNAKPKPLLYNSDFDDITACGCDISSNQLWFGHKSGRVSVYKCSSVESNQRKSKSRQNYVRNLRLSYNSAFRKISTKSSDIVGTSKTDTEPNSEIVINHSPHINPSSTANTEAKKSADLFWRGPTVLLRHTDEITDIALSVEFKIAVTAGLDSIAVIWDLNDLNYIRTIERPAEIYHSPVSHIAISPTLGDIVTVHTLSQHNNGGTSHVTESSSLNSINVGAQSADECFEVTEESLDDFVNVNIIDPNGKCMLRLHSINGRNVQHIVHKEHVHAICYSYIKEGVGVNVIATAMEGGYVRLWSSWNLSFVCEIVTGTTSLRSITFTTHQHLVVLTRESHIQVWETEGLYGNPPKFPQIAYK